MQCCRMYPSQERRFKRVHLDVNELSERRKVVCRLRHDSRYRKGGLQWGTADDSGGKP